MVGKGSNGLYAGRNLNRKRKRYKWLSKKYKRKKLKLWKKYNALEGAPQASGIVLEKITLEQRQPHSGLIKCVRVRLKKNGVVVTAHAPRDKAITFINEHDEVVIAGIGGSQGGPIGSIPGVRYKVVMVNGVDLQALRKGKREKPKR